MSTAEYAEVAPNLLARDIIRHLSVFDIDLPRVKCYRWLKGKSYDALSELRIVEAPVSGRVHYVTAGVSNIVDTPGYGLEFCMQAPQPSTAHIELLAMVAFMHSDPSHRLWVGHTLNIGRPIVDGSVLDRLLISLPYPYGEDFEFIHLSNGEHARVFWMLPIDATEERFVHAQGLEKLEERFDDVELDYLDFFRSPVVSDSELR